jgi:PKD repeat protein
VGGALYIATHVHQCQNIGAWLDTDPETFHYGAAYSRAAVGVNGPFTWQNANFVGTRAPAILPWWPTFASGTFTGQFQAGWSVAGNDRYVVYAGEFPKVNGVAQQGLVRFALPGTAPGKVGPTGGGATPTLTPTVVSLSPGTARVSWRESVDQDNANLTYRVYRDGGTTPVYEVTSASSWYDTQLLGFTDTGLTAGTHTYRVGVVDPQGNKNTGGTTSVTVAAGTTPARRYADLVRADGATDLWSLGERSGATGWDRANGSDLTLNGGVAVGQAGAIAGDTDTAASFNGTTTGFAATKTPVLAPQTFSMETWFSTRTTAGGKLLGFGANATGTSVANDRNVWMSTTGRVNFGVWPMTNKIVSSTKAYNDGRWHHLVATFTSGSMALYVDGVQVGSRTDVLMAQPIFGYWRVGGDTTWDGAQFFNGTMDEVAVYPSVLSAGQVANHYAAGTTGTPTNTAPTAAFTSTVAQLTASFDGSGSADADGRVTAWSWSFGDGTTGTGATATHTYAADGTYAVTLTVTDDKGATATRTATVTVAAPKPNQAPTAAFTSATAGRTASFDASTSKDADGTVTAFAWKFGDGTTGDGVKASHVYAADGSYPVTLTVTDDKGATATASGTVTVSSTSLAADTFQRTVSGGWGTADQGGPWTAWAGATRQSVAPGTGSLDLAVGANTGSYLGAVQQTSVDLTTTMSLSATPTGGGASVYVTGRRVAANQEYRARLRFLASGQVMVGFTRLAGTSSEALVGTEVALPGTYTPGTALTVRVQVSGTGTTTLAATVWPAGTAQPATATLTRTDATASLQAAGSIGVAGYLSSTATAPVSVRVTRFSAVPAA